METSNFLQNHLNSIEKWITKWQFKTNPNNSVCIPISLKRTDPSSINFKGTLIPTSLNVKYLWITLDKRLILGPNLKLKKKILNGRLHLLRPILKSKLSIRTQLIIYKSFLSYGHMRSKFGAVQSHLKFALYKHFNRSLYA